MDSMEEKWHRSEFSVNCGEVGTDMHTVNVVLFHCSIDERKVS